jgi:hypothetical protein
MYKIDISAAFLKIELGEEVYVQRTPAIASQQAWKLKKARYGLKQATRALK